MTRVRDRSRVVVVAGESATLAVARQLADAHRHDEIVLVVPVLLGRLQVWTGDDREACRIAELRLAAWRELLDREGVVAGGYVTRADPNQLIEDALALSGAGDVLLIAHADDHRQVRRLAQHAARHRLVTLAA